MTYYRGSDGAASGCGVLAIALAAFVIAAFVAAIVYFT